MGGFVIGFLVLGQAPAARPEVPPLVLPASAVEPPAPLPAVPNGQTVSQPLSPNTNPPVEVTVPADPPPLPADIESDGFKRPLGARWERLELLWWWPKPGSLPALVTSSRGRTTETLLGGGKLDGQDVGGMRLTLGQAVNNSQTAGFEVSYMFLGTRSQSWQFGDPLNQRVATLSRPYIDANTGAESALLVSRPGVANGFLEVTNTSRATGWEVNGVGSVLAVQNAKFTALAGYRYFMLNEGLRVEQTTTLLPTAFNPQILAASADQFDASSRFHGGQLGLHAEFRNGPVFIELVGKIGLGRTVEVVRASGQTATVTAGYPLSLPQTLPAGFLAGPANTGRITRSAFAVLPEGQFKIGCKISDDSVFYVGYDFIYLSEAVRAADQIDRTIDPANTAFVPPGFAGGDRPRLGLKSSEFWLQGLTFGFDWKY